MPTITLDTIYVKQGTDRAFTVNFASNNIAIDITGREIYFVVRGLLTLPETNDTNLVIDKLMTITDAINGIATFNLSNIETNVNIGDYIYEISFKKPDNTISSHYGYGNFTVQYLSNKVFA